jgi:hypothetical protein
MAKPKGVIKLRHHKEPHLEVHLYQDPETRKVIAQVIDWERGKVIKSEENKEEAKEKTT